MIKIYLRRHRDLYLKLKGSRTTPPFNVNLVEKSSYKNHQGKDKISKMGIICLA